MRNDVVGKKGLHVFVDIAEARGVADVERGYSVNRRVVEIERTLRVHKPVELLHGLPVFDAHKPDRAYRRAACVGGFEIYRRKIHAEKIRFFRRSASTDFPKKKRYRKIPTPLWDYYEK